MLSYFFFHCVACQFPLHSREDRITFPLCRTCCESLVQCPLLCPKCGGPLCLERAEKDLSESQCTRPWIQRPEIHSYSARYLLLNPCYSVLKKWKTRRGRIFDQRVLKSNSSILDQWKRFQGEAVVPIPQNYKRAWKMGGSRAEKIAEWVSRETGLPLIRPLEPPVSFRKRKRQAEMNLNERLQNRILFQLNVNELEGFKRILLVDDFMTTGKTLSHAAKLLKMAGANEIHVFCLGVRIQNRL